MDKPIKVESNHTVNLPDQVLECDTSAKPVVITLCEVGEDSIKGVTIHKSSTNYHILIDRDKIDGEPTVNIHSGTKYLNCIIVRREKTHPVNLKYSDGTWYLSTDKEVESQNPAT